MAEWWRQLAPGERRAFAIYGIGVGLALLALALPFYRNRSITPTWGFSPTWRVVADQVELILRHPQSFYPRSLEGFFRFPLPELAFLCSYGLVLPGVLLLLFATRLRWCCWGGRFLWPALFVAGPVLLANRVASVWLALGEGFWLWPGWLLVAAAAFWILPVPTRVTRPDCAP